MPLSKERMRKRKRLDRLIVKLPIRFDKAVITPVVKPELDADGNVIPEYY